LKADVFEAGEGCSDNQIIQALATSASMVYRVRIASAVRLPACIKILLFSSASLRL